VISERRELMKPSRSKIVRAAVMSEARIRTPRLVGGNSFRDHGSIVERASGMIGLFRLFATERSPASK
jgi:hypothetical protein